MSSPTKPNRKKSSARTSHNNDDDTFQTTTAQLHATELSRSTNFSFKKDFVKDSMVVLGPERTFKLRNPLVHSTSSVQQNSGLLRAATDEGSAKGSSTSPITTIHKIHSGDRLPSVSRSYSLSSYDEIIRNASKHGRRWPLLLLGTLFCVGIITAFSLYFGLINNQSEKLVELVYRGEFLITEGGLFDPSLTEIKSTAFTRKARDFETKLDGIFKNSSVKSVYHYSEVLAFERNAEKNLAIIFNVYCWTNKTVDDAIEIKKILQEYLALEDSFTIDISSIEVKARQMDNDFDRLNEFGSHETISKGDVLNILPSSSPSPPTHDLPSSKFDNHHHHVNRNHSSHPTAIHTHFPFDEKQHQGCVSISLDFCRHLSYNFTSFPNLLGHRSVREVDRFNEAAKLLLESECSPYIQHVLCHILQPPCYSVENTIFPDHLETSHSLPPCRSVCKSAADTCKTRLEQLTHNFRYSQGFNDQKLSKHIATGLRDLLRCELFSEDNKMCTSYPALNQMMETEPSECVLFMMANGQKRRICDGTMDCLDFSDEISCLYCTEGQVHCGVGAACIDVEKRCDGTVDCPNGSDERGCLTVAPDMVAANFVHQYFHEGYVVFTEGNNTGKICVDSLNSSSLLSLARQQSFLEVFGESACRSMSYRIMERIEVRTDNERSLDYAHLAEPVRLRATFLGTFLPCRKRQVLYLSCSGLECGTRPVHMHPDRPNLTMLPSAHGDWPWLAALIREGVHSCDATLVADQWLITSSSCFDGQNRAHWVARFAAVRLTSDAPWEQERRIIGMVKSPLKGNQLVLIKMETPVIYSDFVRPVCLSRNHEDWIDTSYSRCLFLGWGKDGDNLHEITAKVVSNPKCNNVTTLCADVFSRADDCQNDCLAGSPLLCQITDGGSWSLVGISNRSIEHHCDRNFEAAERVYLGVSSIADWVMQTIRR